MDIILPNAKPSFTHCTFPTKFEISHCRSASEPSSTCRFFGTDRKTCFADTLFKAAHEVIKRKKFKLVLIKYNYRRSADDADDLLSCFTHYKE